LSASRTSSLSQFNRPSTQNPLHKDDTKGKSFEWDNRNKGPEFSKLVSQPSVINVKIMDT